MENASFVLKDNTISVNIPISKSSIDLERRVVSGWATIDNVDQMGDVVTAEASLRAFENFRGNVREMHDKFKAVGKVLSFRQQEYIDSEGQLHTGIYVDVYISKGAEDTWEKIIDGTLSGFSIYGPVPDYGLVKQYVPEEDKVVSFVTAYDLIELSLVDSPGNELCNILAIQKSADPTGLATRVDIDNVFWCEVDQMAFVSKTEDQNCAVCKEPVENLGWVESGEIHQIKKVLESKNKISKVNQPNVSKGGNEMPENEENEVVETAEVAEVEAEETVEKTEGPDLAGIAAVLDEIKSSLQRSSAEGEERELALSKVREAVEGVEASVEKRLSVLQDNHEKLVKEFSSLKEGLNTVEKRLGVFEEGTAIRKSADVEDEDYTVRKQRPKSVWHNSLLPDSFDK